MFETVAPPKCPAEIHYDLFLDQLWAAGKNTRASGQTVQGKIIFLLFSVYCFGCLKTVIKCLLLYFQCNCIYLLICHISLFSRKRILKQFIQENSIFYCLQPSVILFISPSTFFLSLWVTIVQTNQDTCLGDPVTAIDLLTFPRRWKRAQKPPSCCRMSVRLKSG